VAVGLAWLAAIAGRMGPLHWTLELAAPFDVHLCAVGAAAAIALAIGRRPGPALLALALAVGEASSFVPLLLAPRDAVPASPPCRVMSCNVLRFNHDHERVIEAVRRESPDVVGFLEVTPEWDAALQSLRDEYPHAVREPRDASFGIELLSRLPFEREQVITWPSKRPAIRVRVDRGGPVDVLLIHPPPPTSAWGYGERESQMRRTAWLTSRADVPLVVMGDMNCTSSSATFARLLREGKLRDSRRGIGLQPSWPDTIVPFRQLAIDHVLVTGDLAVLGRHLAGALGSDHASVVCDLARRTLAEPDAP
jgi:endonuclease/exonuclease/phosphatase (EEP) superfamily protein YafD